MRGRRVASKEQERRRDRGMKVRGLNNRLYPQIMDREMGKTDALLSVSYICSFGKEKAQIEI